LARFHPLRVGEVRKETDDCVSLRLDVPDELRAAFAHRQGQHLILRARLGGEELRRTYSICSGAGEGELRIAVKRQPGGRFSAWANEGLRPGDVVEAMPPAGRFFTELDPCADGRLYVAFAAGSGITPVLSILKTVLATEPRSRCVLVYGNRTTASIVFREELEDLKNRHMTRLSLFHVLSGEPQDIDLLNGRIDPAKVRAVCERVVDPAAVHAWFLCGPAPMIGEVAATLAELGVERRRVHYEFFTTEGNAPRQRLQGPATVEAGAGERSRVAVVAEGKRIEFELPYNDAAILDAALAAGADLPYACKGGVCCTCRAKVVEGKVAMAVNYALEDWELEKGFVLACQARPLTGRVVLDYDAV
jgi:ring-1,2-phenylacetyl-CoA epoxidase subunit PaaE